MTCNNMELEPTIKIKFGATGDTEQHYRCVNCETRGTRNDLKERHGLKAKREIRQDNSQKNISSPVDDFDKFWYSEQDISDNDRGDIDTS